MKIKNYITVYASIVSIVCFGFMFVDAYSLAHSTLTEDEHLWYFLPLVPMFIIIFFAGAIIITSIRNKEFYYTYDEIVKFREYLEGQNKILQDKIKALGEKEAQKIYETTLTDLPGMEGKEIIKSSPQIVKENSSTPSDKNVDKLVTIKLVNLDTELDKLSFLRWVRDWYGGDIPHGKGIIDGLFKGETRTLPTIVINKCKQIGYKFKVVK